MVRGIDRFRNVWSRCMGKRFLSSSECRQVQYNTVCQVGKGCDPHGLAISHHDAGNNARKSGMQKWHVGSEWGRKGENREFFSLSFRLVLWLDLKCMLERWAVPILHWLPLTLVNQYLYSIFLSISVLSSMQTQVHFILLGSGAFCLLLNPKCMMV